MTDATRARKPATPHVAHAQKEFVATLPEDDRLDFSDAERGYIDGLADAEYRAASGRTVWSLAPYSFLRQREIPDTVNPSLWRQAQLNLIHGLFEVVPGVYQIRGMDLANMTIVEGETGIIVIDALSSIEGAQAALALYRRNRGERPVSGVIITHTHADHWGGVLGVADADDFASGRIPLIAPDGYMEHAVSENVIAGNAMRRRALYQFGTFLERGERGHVDNGLGKDFAIGRKALVPPNDLIRETGDTRKIDGILFEFQMAPDTEAPAEMHIFTPSSGVLNMAENAVRNFHNLLPFRGAQVRNALNWSRYISEALELWGGRATVLIGQHHWPVWGRGQVIEYLQVQRDLYKFTHDQTLRLINRGLTPTEIAETLRLPGSLEDKWYARGYYGSLRHNVKAIYQHYIGIGWYDGVPANLDPLPPAETGAKMLEYMGGADAVVARARADFERGEYRWVAQVLNHVVFAEPGHQAARDLLADTYEQLGYLSECATWRNSYLFGAQELREGVRPLPNLSAASVETLAALSSSQLFDFLAVHLDGVRAEGMRLVLAMNFTDTEETFVLNLQNCALTHVAGRQADDADLSLVLSRKTFDRILARQLSVPQAIEAGHITFSGDIGKFAELFGLFETPQGDFSVIEP